jgi:hypothetical protein
MSIRKKMTKEDKQSVRRETIKKRRRRGYVFMISREKSSGED